MRNITIYFDGGVHNKRVAVVDLSSEGKILIWENADAKTSNELERIGLLKALEYVYKKYGAGAKNVVIYGDNITGFGVKRSRTTRMARYRSHNPRLKRFEQLKRMCERRLAKFHKPIEVKWIPRRKNLAGHVLEMMYNMDARLKYRKAIRTTWEIKHNC